MWYNIQDLGRASDASSPPVLVGTGLEDQPTASAMLQQLNGVTGQMNLLHEVQIERFFCAILTLLTGEGEFRHLASRYWNLRWQARFHPSDFDQPSSATWRVTLVEGGNGSAVSPTILGPPTDRRFVHVVTSPLAPMCNDLIKGARNVVDNFLLNGEDNPLFDSRTRRESAVWSTFDVRN
jgi:hypothetical protein